MFKVRPILALSAAFLLPTSAAGLQGRNKWAQAVTVPCAYRSRQPGAV